MKLWERIRVEVLGRVSGDVLDKLRNRAVRVFCLPKHVEHHMSVLYERWTYTIGESKDGEDVTHA